MDPLLNDLASSEGTAASRVLSKVTMEEDNFDDIEFLDQSFARHGVSLSNQLNKSGTFPCPEHTNHGQCVRRKHQLFCVGDFQFGISVNHHLRYLVGFSVWHLRQSPSLSLLSLCWRLFTLHCDVLVFWNAQKKKHMSADLIFLHDRSIPRIMLSQTYMFDAYSGYIVIGFKDCPILPNLENQSMTQPEDLFLGRSSETDVTNTSMWNPSKSMAAEENPMSKTYFLLIIYHEWAPCCPMASTLLPIYFRLGR